MSVFIESFLGSFLGIVVSGGMLMGAGMLLIKPMVRRIMNEIWEAAAERIISSTKGKKKKGNGKKYVEPLMNK